MTIAEVNKKYNTNIREILKAEFTAACLASEVHEKVYGKIGLVEDGFPEVDFSLHKDNVGYHVRTGGHNLLLFDWRAYMDFADKLFGFDK